MHRQVTQSRPVHATVREMAELSDGTDTTTTTVSTLAMDTTAARLRR